MKKNGLLVLIIFSFFTFIPLVSANTGYYYEDAQGKYVLCGGSYPGCETVEKGQNGVTFNLNSGYIELNGHRYIYDSIRQEEYDRTQQGITNMYYYMDGDRYVLCKKKNSCVRYTFDALIKKNASVTPGVSVAMNNGDGPGEPGDIYYYNANINSSGDNGEAETDGSETVSNDACTRLKEPLKFIGNIVLVVKIVIPIIIIIFGAVDFFRSMMGSKEDEVKKSLRLLLFRCISGLVIFLLPTVVSVVFSLVDSWASIKGDFNACQKCVLNVKECK